MRSIAFILASLFLITSCKYGSNKGVKKPYKNLIKTLESEVLADRPDTLFRLKKAKKIKEIADNQIKSTNKVPTFSNRYYLFETTENTTQRLDDMFTRVDNHIKSCEDTSLSLQKEIHALGKQQYLLSQNKSLNISTQELIMNDVIILHSLQYMKRMYETCAGLTFHYINEFSAEKYNEYENIFKIREDLLKNFMGLSGMLKVIAKDSAIISQKLTSAKENNLISETQENLVVDLATKMRESTQKLQEITDNTLARGLDENMKESYDDMQLKANKIFKDKTILFDPANPDHPVVHVLVILSNLTWGSIQTSIGLGIVLSHTLIVTPLSWLLEAIWPYHFMKLKGPRLDIASNGMQIYADVCGFPAIPSKMSMGLFELDFCTGYNFASAHEGGHAKQSALLGPLYLPAAILSYAINLGHGGFIENWADDWYVH